MARILFSGGGSGGHLFPGIAVAEELRERSADHECVFVGSKRPIEDQILRPFGFRHHGLVIPACYSIYKTPIRAARSFWQAYRLACALVEDLSPQVIVGLGGGISVPSVLAASRRKIPVILLEQNAVLGRANRALLPLADHLALSYDKTPVPRRYAKRASVTGNPIRRQILHGSTEGIPSERNGLLILGGSQGAKAINDVVLEAFSRLCPLLGDWRITHQTGRENMESVASAYRRLGISARVVPFLDDMGSIYSQTGLAISRAGGTTLAELAVHGVPAVLVPYPNSVRDHQALNARRHEEAGGAVMVPQSSRIELTANQLCEALPALLGDSNLRGKRGEAMQSLAYPDASQVVANRIEALCAREPASKSTNEKSSGLARAS